MIASCNKMLDLTGRSDDVSWDSRLTEYMIDVSESVLCNF